MFFLTSFFYKRRGDTKKKKKTDGQSLDGKNFEVGYTKLAIISKPETVLFGPGKNRANERKSTYQFHEYKQF